MRARARRSHVLSRACARLVAGHCRQQGVMRRGGYTAHSHPLETSLWKLSTGFAPSFLETGWLAGRPSVSNTVGAGAAGAEKNTPLRFPGYGLCAQLRSILSRAAVREMRDPGDIIGGEMMVCRYQSISPDKSQLRIWLKTQTLGTICLRCVGRLWRRVWNKELVACRVGRMVVWSCAPEARSKISQFPALETGWLPPQFLGNWLAGSDGPVSKDR